MQNYAQNFIVKNVTMVRHEKVVSTIICCLQNTKNMQMETFWILLETILCKNYAILNLHVVIVIRNLRIVLDYGNIKRNV